MVPCWGIMPAGSEVTGLVTVGAATWPAMSLGLTGACKLPTGTGGVGDGCQRGETHPLITTCWPAATLGTG